MSDSDFVYRFTCTTLVLDLPYHLPLHTNVAGSGLQVPFDDIPSDVHTAVILPVGTNPVLHLKIV